MHKRIDVSNFLDVRSLNDEIVSQSTRQRTQSTFLATSRRHMPLTQATSPSVLYKIIHFPVTRMVIALRFVFVPISVVQTLLKMIGGPFDTMLLFTVLAVPLALLAYWGYVRTVESRSATEISLIGSPKEFGTGALTGAALFSATIGIIAALGYYHVTGTQRWEVLIDSLTLSVMSGFLEELLARGIIFRILEEWLGTWIALALSAAMFGAIHLGNPHAIATSAVAIALEAGLLLGACYVLTRRLWLAIGVHAAWNFTQGGIFGVSVSGTGANGILQSTLSGPDILSGGAFGAEASVVAVIVCVTAFLFIVAKAHRKGHIIRPFWLHTNTGQTA
jgi:membrane protease YdiL (CAAX protease family)